MYGLHWLLYSLAIVVILCTLPTATQCDSSYYEKYYSARRYTPLKRTTMLHYNFTLELRDELLGASERLAIVGDLAQLGGWSAQGAILMNRSSTEHNHWSATVPLPVNASVSYRYFAAAVDNETSTVQIRRWESSLQARTFQTHSTAGQRHDVFGYTAPAQKREVQRGWLNSGKLVQFKLFRNPLHLTGLRAAGERILVKLQPVEPQMLTPILSSAKANTEYVRMRYGDSFLRPQPEYGVPYEEDDIVIFQTSLVQLQSVVYLLKLYRAREGNDFVSLMCYQYIYPDLLEGSEGSFSINLISPIWLNAIGSIEIQYLVISPLANTDQRVDFRTSFAELWRPSWQQLDVGHRGLGRSLKLSANVPAITENTLASIQASADLGADMVEFDVMLTSDLVPIIYHDYVVYVCIESKKPTSKDDLTQVLIKDITYDQLKNLKTYQVIGSKIIEYPAHNNVEQVEHRLFPRFEDFLTQVNRSLGFNVEIKWPQPKMDGSVESVQSIDKNVYVDRILDVMLRHGCGRLSFFSSFDADICTLLRYKQNMYPVFFLSPSKQATYVDPRSDTIYHAVNNAQAFDLAGIVPNGVFLQKEPNWVKVARKQHKLVFVWGDALKDVDTIKWFKSLDVTGVIYDRLDLWLPLDKQNLQDREADLAQLLQLQCAAVRNGSASADASTNADKVLSSINSY